MKKTRMLPSACLIVALLAVSGCSGLLADLDDINNMLDASYGLNDTTPIATPVTTPKATLAPIQAATPTPGSGEAAAATTPVIKNIQASSRFSASFDIQFLVDGDEETPWISQDGDVNGAWIKVEFEEPSTVTSMLILNGYDLNQQEFSQHGKLEGFELIFDDGSRDTLSVRVEDGFWSTDFPPIITKSIEIRILSSYPGESYDTVAISELEFYNDPNSFFAEIERDQANKPDEQSTTAQPGGAGEDNTGFVPKSFAWSDGGYGDQSGWGFELTDIRAGKWLTADGNSALYIDYDSTPDGFYYEMYHNGKSWSSYTEIPDTDYSFAEDWEKKYTFTIVKKEVMEVDLKGEVLTFYLKRAKYTKNS
ncbi:discoidin domain-containing protein [Christensenellaceae bacterium OttesenSCG-928-M15]|nr:discoidin domain-containing protein [Christensenellaceae bacterium OttesenSCG-928-M15]